jgi:hypothetical protein
LGQFHKHVVPVILKKRQVIKRKLENILCSDNDPVGNNNGNFTIGNLQCSATVAEEMGLDKGI